MVRALGGRGLPELRVLVALATILGHNFPVYLKLRGGKGVATSLGALLALDPVASGATVAAFVIFLMVTRYVSLSSLLGGLVFVVVHFARTDRPWDRDQRAMSLATLALLVLLVVRHRKNLARIGAGTEPKVGMGRKRPEPPSGRVATGLLVAIVVAPLAVGPGDPGRSTPGVDGRALSAGRDGPGRHGASTRRARGVRRSGPAAGGHLPEVQPGRPLRRGRSRMG